MPAAPQSEAERVAQLGLEECAKWLTGQMPEELSELEYYWPFWARNDQRSPFGDWRTWFVMAGRGFGKTRMAAEYVRSCAEADGSLRIALVAATLHEARSIMVEGESGLLAIAPEELRPTWEPSLKRLVWPSGAIAHVFAASEPEALRGPEHHLAWADEVAKWERGVDAWDNLMMTMRLGEDPRIVATTTPRAVPLVRRLLKEDGVAITRGAMAANRANLPTSYRQAMAETYGKAWLGRQELLGEFLEDAEDALWTRDLIERCRVKGAPEMRRIVIGVDPPASAGGDACGIIAVGKGADGKAYVLADHSVKGRSPEGWARAVSAAALAMGADRVVAEANNGGDMVNRPTPIPVGPAVVGLNGKSIEQTAKIRNAKSDEGASIALRYFERERDYQAGLQRYGAGPMGRFETQFELPACLDAAQAQRLAALNWRQQNRSKLKSVSTVPFQAIPHILTANIVSPANKVTEIEYFRGCLRVSSLGWVSSDIAPSANGDPGRDVSAPDLAVGETLLHLIDLPVVSEPLPTQPLIGVVAAGTGQGWRKAALAFHDGSALRELGRTAPPGVIGWLQDPISTHEAHLIDHSNSFRVRVHHDAMDLPPGYGDPLHPDAPVVHIAGEFIKYGDCTKTGPLEFRLSNLVRGCFGSETLAKPVGASLCRLNKESIAQFSNLGVAFERSALFEAHGIGDASPVLASLSAVGRAIQPLPPCHLAVKFDQVQGISINWIRRSRLDTGWRDYADLPFDETESVFEVKLERGQQLLAIYEAGAEWLEIPQAVVTAWGVSAGDSVNVSVR